MFEVIRIPAFKDNYIWLLRNDKPASHQGRVMLIDARQQCEKEPKAFGNKRNRIADAHREWIEARYRAGWAEGFEDADVKRFNTTDFATAKARGCEGFTLLVSRTHADSRDGWFGAFQRGDERLDVIGHLE